MADLTVEGSEPANAERADRLKRAIKSIGTAKLASERSGVPLGTLNAYLAGREMKFSNATAIAEATGVRLEWLATGQGPMRPGQPGFEERPVDSQGKPLDGAPAGAVPIPRYDARASAGIGTSLDPGWMVEKVLFSADFIRNKLRRNAEHLALIDCSGDSMEPTLHHGDQLLVDTSVREARSGAIYILRVAGALLAKRVQQRLDGTVMIISDNTRYPPELVTPSDDLPLDIVGEVVWRGGLLLPG